MLILGLKGLMGLGVNITSYHLIQCIKFQCPCSLSKSS